MRCRETKTLYPNHSTPFPTFPKLHTLSNRLLGVAEQVALSMTTAPGIAAVSNVTNAAAVVVISKALRLRPDAGEPSVTCGAGTRERWAVGTHTPLDGDDDSRTDIRDGPYKYKLE